MVFLERGNLLRNGVGERGEVLAALVSNRAVQAVPIRLHLCAPPQEIKNRRAFQQPQEISARIFARSFKLDQFSCEISLVCPQKRHGTRAHAINERSHEMNAR